MGAGMRVKPPEKGAYRQHKRVGRHTKLTRTLQRRMVALLRLGVSDGAAIEVAGIAPSSFYLWLKRGREEPRGIYHTFAVAVMVAKAQCMALVEMRMYEASPLTWLCYMPSARETGNGKGWTKKRGLVHPQGHATDRVTMVTQWGEPAQAPVAAPGGGRGK